MLFRSCSADSGIGILSSHERHDPESALRKTNRKFRRRFQWMESRLEASGRSAEEAPVEELESLWQQAKAHEHDGGEKSA